MAEAGRKRLRQCSKGMRQRLKLAQALVHDPQVLVLDEPLTGIDPPGRRELLSLFLELRRRGKTVLVSSHILEEVEAIADHVILMAQGRVLAAGAVEEIRRLLAKHPLTVRVKSPQARRLAALVVADDGVAGVALESSPEDGEAGILTVRIHDPERFFRELPGRIAREKIDVEALEALDAGAAAIFDYLIEGRSSSAR
jgi:ABC-2 type transport system ATP-binding protein